MTYLSDHSRKYHDNLLGDVSYTKLSCLLIYATTLAYTACLPTTQWRLVQKANYLHSILSKLGLEATPSNNINAHSCISHSHCCLTLD